MESRPELSTEMEPAEFARWYWTKVELAGLARDLRIPIGGSKVELSNRIQAALSGQALPPRRKRRSPEGSQLAGPLNAEMVIPPGQKRTAELRSWMQAQIGPQCRFDQNMREFIYSGSGRTLGDAVQHWHATRSIEPAEIASQFELNRFTRTWRSENPGASRERLLETWREYRATPIDRR